MRYLSFLLIFGFFTLATPSMAADFRSVGPSPIIMYDAPTFHGIKKYVAPAGMPVEVILTQGSWCRVKDASGEFTWVEGKDLVARRNLVVKAANARIRATPDENAVMVFSADKHVLLEMAEAPTGAWVKVKHRDGQTGYVRVSDIWGL